MERWGADDAGSGARMIELCDHAEFQGALPAF